MGLLEDEDELKEFNLSYKRRQKENEINKKYDNYLIKRRQKNDKFNYNDRQKFLYNQVFRRHLLRKINTEPYALSEINMFDKSKHKKKVLNSSEETSIDINSNEIEIEEIENLFEFYLQRAATAQAEAERNLQLARDLEESISVNLSARRFEINRLELTLAIGNFAVATGALIAGVFGMNLRTYFENSLGGFVAVSLIILLIVFFIGYSFYCHTKVKKIF